LISLLLTAYGFFLISAELLEETFLKKGYPPNLFPKTFNVFGEGYHVPYKTAKA
jgi:hypothetical protein